ncbi:MAG TPA: hypothetical protein VJN18_35870 [Polyangiaceae bacterium]|nr:hypothetical protein [Polyangiaceae bacterium]
MAGGQYIIDPATGMPVIQSAGGAALPLPLSPLELEAAGFGPPAPPEVPDARLASNAGIPDLPPEAGIPSEFGRGAKPAHSWAADLSQFNAPVSPSEQKAIDERRAAATAQSKAQAEENARRRASAAYAAAQDRAAAARAEAARPSVDPSTLARGGGPGGGQVASAQGDPSGLDDPLIQQAMAEAMRGSGGGGPRQLGVTGQTRKYKMAGEVPLEVSQATGEAQGASDAYNEQLAMALDRRREEAYQVTQGEMAARAGQMAAVAERQAQQRQMLGQYEAKRDAAAAEAAQLKVPQMEEYWGSRTTLTRVATALSIALGGALSGLRGGPNQGLEASNQEIERWIVSQREEYQRAREQTQDIDNQYARMVRNFESENLAEQHLREQAWSVRDGMLKSYAEKVGNPGALEAFNQAQLETEAKRAALRQQAFADASVEIEEKLAMQGGGGGGQSGVLKMLRAGAEAKKLKDVIAGAEGQQPFQREVQNEKVEGINGALEAIEAADEVQASLRRLGAEGSDLDDPLSGAWDSTLGNIPGTDQRKVKQRLDQQTALLARGIQQSLGKSDNDARLADEMAAGGGSGLQRDNAAKVARQRAQGRLQGIVSSLTPAQQQTLLQSLRANSPARAAQVEAAIAATATPQIAPSEQAVP